MFNEIMLRIANILAILTEKGASIYLVGGAVRDILMEAEGVLPRGTKPKDFDFCITGITQPEFENVFTEARKQGKDFPVYAFCELPDCEFSLARIERKTGMGYKAFEIATSPTVTIEDDLIRRDFTINSIAFDFSTGNLVDPFDGMRDINKGILRAISPAFAEDPLRVYRAAQFAARFNFKIEPDTLVMMNSLKDELITLSKERVFEETKKALKSTKPSIYFQALKDSGVLDVHFPEIANLIGAFENENYRTEDDVFRHTMEVLDQVAQKSRTVEIRFAALVYNIGKGIDKQHLLQMGAGYDKIGAEFAAKISKRLGLPKSWRQAGMTSAAMHMRAEHFDEMKPDEKVSFLEEIDRTRLGLEGLEIIVAADGKDVCFSELGRRMMEEVKGRTLGIKEGPKAREIIHAARIKWMKMQVEGELL